MFYSGYMGNEKYRSVADFRENRPEFIITNAVKGMLPKNKLSSGMLTRLRVFRGEEHARSTATHSPPFLNFYTMSAKAKQKNILLQYTGKQCTSSNSSRFWDIYDQQ